MLVRDNYDVIIRGLLLVIVDIFVVAAVLVGVVFVSTIGSTHTT